MNVVAYYRASTALQELSPEAQRHAVEQWAQKNGATIVAHHCDQGVSGGAELEDRPALLAALRDVRDLRAKALIVAKRDRLARDTFVAATIDRLVAKSRATIICADGVGNGDNPADHLLRGILDNVAQFERKMIKARTRDALAAKRRRGERLGGQLPFGYDEEDGRLVLHEEEQRLISYVRDLRRKGLSLRAIVQQLAEEQRHSRSGRPFGLTQVVRMLKTQKETTG